MQYKESSFAFLKSFVAIYNELFFYDGKNIVFGCPENETPEKLIFREDINQLKTISKALPYRIIPPKIMNIFLPKRTNLLTSKMQLRKPYLPKHHCLLIEVFYRLKSLWVTMQTPKFFVRGNIKVLWERCILLKGGRTRVKCVLVDLFELVILLNLG